jgi:hypothetical protein
MRPAGWLPFSSAAREFREVNDARDYAAQYRVRATRARTPALRGKKTRVRVPSRLP